MRRVTASVVGALLLVGGCGTSGDGNGSDGNGNGSDGDSDGGATMSYETVKSSVDDLTTKLLPELASGLGGEFPAVRGQFVECGVGPQSLRYTVRGELHSQVADDAEAAESIRAVLTDAGLGVEVDDDQTVKATVDGADVVVSGGVEARGGTFIRAFSIDTQCETYSDSDADTIADLPAATY